MTLDNPTGYVLIAIAWFFALGTVLVAIEQTFKLLRFFWRKIYRWATTKKVRPYFPPPRPVSRPHTALELVQFANEHLEADLYAIENSLLPDDVKIRAIQLARANYEERIASILRGNVRSYTS